MMSARARTAIVLGLALALALTLDWVIWLSPFPISEAVALFEDVQQKHWTRFLIPDSSYYRPLFYAALSAVWYSGADIAQRLAGIKLLHIAAITLLLLLMAWRVRPRGRHEMIAAAVAVLVVVGSPGFRDNLELTLLYTIVGMPIALACWMLLEHQQRWWTSLAIVLLTVVAVGFKEQGLVIVPLVVAAWWLKAPGSNRWVAAVLAFAVVPYVIARYYFREHVVLFEQAIGIGFREMEPPEATARFGAFPYPLYAFSALSTILNVLFAEPTRGVFGITGHIIRLHPSPMELVNLGSSTLLTGLIAWWGARHFGAVRQRAWSQEAGAWLAVLVAIAACGVLSFNYSRDRLGGMAVPFYALAAFHAVSAAAQRLSSAEHRQHRTALIVVIAAIAAGWSLRALATVDYAVVTAWRNHDEWRVQLPQRRGDFAGRTIYLKTLESMTDQGLAAPKLPRGGVLTR